MTYDSESFTHALMLNQILGGDNVIFQSLKHPPIWSPFDRFNLQWVSFPVHGMVTRPGALTKANCWPKMKLESVLIKKNAQQTIFFEAI